MLDTIACLVGEIDHLSAELQVQQPQVRFVDSGDELHVTTPALRMHRLLDAIAASAANGSSRVSTES
jgi:hypothetical protein